MTRVQILIFLITLLIDTDTEIDTAPQSAQHDTCIFSYSKQSGISKQLYHFSCLKSCIFIYKAWLLQWLLLACQFFLYLRCNVSKSVSSVRYFASKYQESTRTWPCWIRQASLSQTIPSTIHNPILTWMWVNFLTPSGPSIEN